MLNVASCPDSCNGHGSCQTLEQLFYSYTKDKTDNTYSTWDANHTTMCVCDVGYTGSSCDISK